MSAAAPTVAVLYLARHAEGIDALRRFADSYRAHPAGTAHQLVVLYKGFLEQSALAAARAVFHDIPHEGLELDDSGFDIGSYLEAIRWLPHDYLCPVSTYTEIAAPGWLALLAKRATKAGVGLAGAMGSYESMLDSQRLFHKARWLGRKPGFRADRGLQHYYHFLLEDEAAPAPAAPGTRSMTASLKRLWLEPRFRTYWKGFVAARDPIDVTRYPGFPNPHIRTTGFMIRRDRLLAHDRASMRTKDDSYAFESGFDGLTVQVRRAGLAAVVVAKDDRDFDVPDWPRSGTFRLGDQRNLLVTDGQSRKFERFDPGSRITNVRFTWGDYVAPPPPDYPDLGLRFPRGALEVR